MLLPARNRFECPACAAEGRRTTLGVLRRRHGDWVMMVLRGQQTLLTDAATANEHDDNVILVCKYGHATTWRAEVVHWADAA